MWNRGRTRRILFGIADGRNGFFYCAKGSAENEGRFKGEHGQPAAPWQHLLRQAMAYHHGLDDNLEDHDEAYRLYDDAARLGSVEAMDILGWMNFNGAGVRQSYRAALQWWKEGAARGDYYCHVSMANAFVSRGETENAAKCWGAFFRDRGAAVAREQPQFDNHERYAAALVHYLIHVNDTGIAGTFLDAVRSNKDKILTLLAEQRTSKTASDGYRAARWRATWWIEDNL